MDMDEIWKECRSLPGYKVSNLGRVKGPKGIRKLCRQNKCGHLKITVTKQGQHRCTLVHKLVADAFLKEQPEGTEILHKDEDPTNNCVTNLMFGTHRQNILMSKKHKKYFRTRRALTDDQVREIRTSTLTHSEIARQYGVRPSIIHAIMVGKTYKDVV